MIEKIILFWKNSSWKKLIRVLQNPLFSLTIVSLAIFLYGVCPEPEKKFFLASFYTPLGAEEVSLFLDQRKMSVAYLPLSTVGENSFRQTGPTSLVKAEVLGSIGSSVVTISHTDLVSRKEILEYLVEEGDTLSFIAEKFAVSLETVLLANDLTSSSKISPGQKLVILPVSGMMHMVENGESLGYLAQLYQVETGEIKEFNELESEDEIFIGDLLIIPNAKKPVKKIVSQSAPLASSYFIRPVGSGYYISQGLHYYNAIDFSNGVCGGPIFASAGGIVQKTGYSSIAGNYVRVLHPNGIVTFYGHMSKISVVAGEKVSQGTIIGYVGNTGYTIGPSGCHLHFEVRGARNPFAY